LETLRYTFISSGKGISITWRSIARGPWSTRKGRSTRWSKWTGSSKRYRTGTRSSRSRSTRVRGSYPVVRGSRARWLMGVLQEHRGTKQYLKLNTVTLHYLSLKSLKKQIQRSHPRAGLQNSRNSKQSSPSRSTRHQKTSSPIQIWPPRPPALHLCTRDSSRTTYCQISMPLQIKSIRRSL
jgi:hypothetical protein